MFMALEGSLLLPQSQYTTKKPQLSSSILVQTSVDSVQEHPPLALSKHCLCKHTDKKGSWRTQATDQNNSLINSSQKLIQSLHLNRLQVLWLPRVSWCHTDSHSMITTQLVRGKSIHRPATETGIGFVKVCIRFIRCGTCTATFRN